MFISQPARLHDYNVTLTYYLQLRIFTHEITRIKQVELNNYTRYLFQQIVLLISAQLSSALATWETQLS